VEEKATSLKIVINVFLFLLLKEKKKALFLTFHQRGSAILASKLGTSLVNAPIPLIKLKEWRIHE